MTHETKPANDAVVPYLRAERVSKLAVVAMAVGIAGLFGCFTVVVPLLALLLGLIANNRIEYHPYVLGGKGFARAGTMLGFVGISLGILFWVWGPFPPHHRGGGELSRRSYCAANLRGILQSMNIYAAENSDVFPLVSYAPYTPAHNNPSASAVDTRAEATLARFYGTTPQQAGSPLASLWILVIENQVSPKQFLCKSDPRVGTTASPILDSGGRYFDSFQSGRYLSYSVAYPWTSDGSPGKWWTAITESSLPLMSDMAPEQGTGTPRRVLNPSANPKDPKTWSSENHNGDGQNVGFSDAHAEFTRRPDIGQDSDNIWTTSGLPSTGPIPFGGMPAGKFAPQIPATQDKPPFDILMLPVRNATNGAM